MWKLVDSEGRLRENLTEEDLVALLRRGEIGTTTLLWMRGFDEWKPLERTELSAHLPRKVLPVPTKQMMPPALLDVLGVARTLAPLAWTAVFLQLLVIAATLWKDWSLLARADSLMEWSILQRAALAQMSAGAPTGLQLIVRVLLALQLLFTLVLIAQWLRWQFRAARNLRSLGARGLRHDPALSLVWWFVPVVNLIMPFLAMGELSRASNRPRQWRKRETPMELRAWWVAWFLSQASALLGWWVGWILIQVNGEGLWLYAWLHSFGLSAVLMGVGAMLVGAMLHIVALLVGVHLAMKISDSQLRQAAKQMVEREIDDESRSRVSG